jgi:hypothetical protein
MKKITRSRSHTLPDELTPPLKSTGFGEMRDQKRSILVKSLKSQFYN